MSFERAFHLPESSRNKRTQENSSCPAGVIRSHCELTSVDSRTWLMEFIVNHGCQRRTSQSTRVTNAVRPSPTAFARDIHGHSPSSPSPPPRTGEVRAFACARVL